jgi:HNH endonuclease/NUMOD4 motif
MDNIGNEIWRDVVGLEKFYRVSNTGLVASKNRDGKDGRKRLMGRILSITRNKKTGQTQVCMSVDGVRYKKEVSLIVAEAFIGEIPDGMEVCHIDCDKGNNHLDNLQILTRKKKARKTLNHYCEPEHVNKSEITQDLLREYFDYVDGELIRKKRTSLVCKIGEPSSYLANSCRKQVTFAGCTLELNRAVYLYHYGVLPDYVLPKDGNTLNCSIENLEAQSASERAKLTNRVGNLPGGGQKKDFCQKGHPKTPDNSEADGRCRLCRQDYVFKKKEQIKARQKLWYQNRKNLGN